MEVLEQQGAAQRTEAWLIEKLGHISGSRMIEVMGMPSTAANYGMDLLAERLTMTPAPEVRSPALDWGRNCEPLAKDAYWNETGRTIVEVPFVKHPSIKWIGVSPDGLIGDEGGVEVKCPYNSAVHLNTWRHGMPAEHKPQVQSNLWVTGRKWWDFISYDPRVKDPRLQLYIQRIYPDPAYIADMQLRCERLLAQVEVEIRQLDVRALAVAAAYAQQGAAA